MVLKTLVFCYESVDFNFGFFFLPIPANDEAENWDSDFVPDMQYLDFAG